MRITKELCENAKHVLNTEGMRHKDGWLGVLNDITNEDPQRESVANLLSTLLKNTPHFATIATAALPKYMVDHPEIKSQDMAIHSLMTQLAVRVVVYIYKHAEESAELQKMFDMDTEEEGNK